MRRAWATLALRWRLRHEHVDQLLRRIDSDHRPYWAIQELRRRGWTLDMIRKVLGW